jgi:hypothetical protein
VLSRSAGAKREEITAGQIKLHNEEFHNSSNII